MGGTGPETGKMAPMTDTETVENPTEPGALPAGPPPELRSWPTWVRRTIIGLVLALAALVLVWGTQGGSPNDDADLASGAVVALFPVNDGQALHQTQIGADLAVGYDGRLTINGTRIPEEQMVGARDPKTVEPSDLKQNGVRPNNRNSVYFKPGPGKVIEELDNGTVTVTLKYFREGREAATSRTVTWSFRVD